MFSFGAPADGAKPFSFGTPSTFGAPAAKADGGDDKAKAAAAGGGAGGAGAGKAKKVTATGEPAVNENAGSQFDALVHLDRVDVTTGEEDEEETFKVRCKLFVFVAEDVYGGEKRSNFWKERGTGDVKVLKHKTTGKNRLLMRQEKTLKIAANHQIMAETTMKPNVGSDRSWVFEAFDFAEEELKHDTFAIRFKNAENANLFKDAYEKAQKENTALDAAAGGGEGDAAAAEEEEPDDL